MLRCCESAAAAAARAGRRAVLTAVVWCLILPAGGCSQPVPSFGTLLQEPEAAESVLTEEVTETKRETPPQNCYVYVCGQVKTPGVYTLPEDARVKDAVDAAGGFTRKADREFWNLAQKITDGEQIRIPSREESEKLKEEAASTGKHLVNLNTASREELMTLNGIGEARADAIIDYRETQGPFLAIEDIMLVSGIKEAAFRRIRDSITV